MDPNTRAWLAALFQGSGMLALVIGGPLFMRGLITGTIRPAEIAARLPHYRDVILDGLTVTLAAVAAVAVLVGVGVLVARHGRVWAGVWVSAWWRYRRRWTSVLRTAGLATAGTPKLAAITTSQTTDVLTVTLLPGQSPAEWDQATPALAAAFGASAARVRSMTADGRRITLEFAYGDDGHHVPLPALLGDARALEPLPARPKPELAASVQAWSLRLSWARVRIAGKDGTGRTWFAGRVQWDTMTRHMLMTEGV